MVLLVGAAGAKADADAARTIMAAADFMVGLDLLVMRSKMLIVLLVSVGVWRTLSFVKMRTMPRFSTHTTRDDR